MFFFAGKVKRKQAANLRAWLFSVGFRIVSSASAIRRFPASALGDPVTLKVGAPSQSQGSLLRLRMVSDYEVLG